MRTLLIALLLIVVQLNTSGNKRIDSYVRQLALQEKVAMLFVAHERYVSDQSSLSNNKALQSLSGKKDSNKIQLSIIDTRFGDIDDLSVPYPDSLTMMSVTSREFKEQFYVDAIRYYAKKGYDGIVTQDEESNLNTLYLDSNKYARQKLRVINFPEDLLYESKPVEVYEVNRYVSDLSHGPSHDYDIGLPFLNIWSTKKLEVSFDEVFDQDVLFWDDCLHNHKQLLVEAFESGQLPEDKLDGKIYDLINRTHADNYISEVSEQDIRQQVNYRFEAFKRSISLYQKKNIFPLKHIDTLSASINDIRSRKNSGFYSVAKSYHPDIYEGSNEKAGMQITLCDNPKQLIKVTKRINSGARKDKRVDILVYTGKLPSSGRVDNFNVFDAIVLMPQIIDNSWSLLAQAMYNGIEVQGVSAIDKRLRKSGFYPVNSQKTRLGFNSPVYSGMEPDSLAKIDSIINDAIKQKATPGAQLLVVRKGDIVIQKSYGHHTYKEKIEVCNDDLYDIASVTKVAATLPVVMQLFDENAIDLNATLSQYIEGIDTTDKSDITIKDLLLHQSGLTSYIPFHNMAIDKNSLRKRSLFSRRYSSVYNLKVDNYLYQNKNARYRKDIFTHERTKPFCRQVNDGFFMNESYVDSMYSFIYNSELRDNGEYIYSDLGYYLLQRVIETEYHASMDSLFYTWFSKKMGAKRLLYNPLSNFKPSEIVPTENDLAFRRDMLHGYVHDQGAAMLGGVAAHAGLFANAGDLAKIGQMFLNGGRYGDVSFIKQETIGKFTKTINMDNRRGLGVDKPEPDPDERKNVSSKASLSSFGHTGFTGTIFWVDPENDLIYIFLSNRIHPNSYNKKLLDLNVRTKVQDVIYNSILES